MAYWLLKSEPEEWSWDDQTRRGIAPWDGVRNHQAANNLRAMKRGERAFFYHTGAEKRIVGVVEVARANYPDPADERFVLVDVKAVKAVGRPVTLAEIKAHPKLQGLALVRHSRLSVVPIGAAEWALLARLAGTEA